MALARASSLCVHLPEDPNWGLIRPLRDSDSLVLYLRLRRSRT